LGRRASRPGQDPKLKANNLSALPGDPIPSD
jgi:hypothetical protein